MSATAGALAPSREQPVHDLAADVGEAVVAALEAERQLLVVEPEQVQQRRVQVVDVHRVLGDVVARACFGIW